MNKPKDTRKDTREERLARALRDNLRKRKVRGAEALPPPEAITTK